MTKVLYPADNLRDLEDVPKSVVDDLEMVGVNHVDEVLRHALLLEDPDAFSLRLGGERALRASIAANPGIQH